VRSKLDASLASTSDDVFESKRRIFFSYDGLCLVFYLVLADDLIARSVPDESVNDDSPYEYEGGNQNEGVGETDHEKHGRVRRLNHPGYEVGRNSYHADWNGYQSEEGHDRVEVDPDLIPAASLFPVEGDMEEIDG